MVRTTAADEQKVGLELFQAAAEQLLLEALLACTSEIKSSFISPETLRASEQKTALPSAADTNETPADARSIHAKIGWYTGWTEEVTFAPRQRCHFSQSGLSPRATRNEA